MAYAPLLVGIRIGKQYNETLGPTKFQFRRQLKNYQPV
jgi:hypothetical protein